MTAVELAATTCPTTSLGVDALERDALNAAGLLLTTAEHVLADLATLRWTATDQGADLPFSREEIAVIRRAVRELAGRTRERQGV